MSIDKQKLIEVKEAAIMLRTVSNTGDLDAVEIAITLEELLSTIEGLKEEVELLTAYKYEMHRNIAEWQEQHRLAEVQAKTYRTALEEIETHIPDISNSHVYHEAYIEVKRIARDAL